MSLMSETPWWYLLHWEMKSWDSTTWLKIWQFQTPAWKRLLASPGWTVCCLEVMIRFLWKKGIKNYQMAPMLPLSTLQRCFSLAFTFLVNPQCCYGDWSLRVCDERKKWCCASVISGYDRSEFLSYEAFVSKLQSNAELKARNPFPSGHPLNADGYN